MRCIPSSRTKRNAGGCYTECGVVELPDAELQRWWANPAAVVRTRLYDALDGARPRPFGITSAALSPDGRVWFATGFIVQMVDPSRLSQKALPPVTYVESVTADRTVLAASDNLKLPAHLRDLQIEYTSPTFTTPQKVRFRYRLDPFDHDWHDAGTRRQAFYTDLPPGNYTFRVMASNSDGVWNESAAKLDFSIAPAFYQRTSFRVLAVRSFPSSALPGLSSSCSATAASGKKTSRCDRNDPGDDLDRVA